MIGKVKIEIICDSCNKQKKEIEAVPLTTEGEQTKIVVFTDQVPQGWFEMSMNHEVKYICDECLKGVPNSGHAL